MVSHCQNIQINPTLSGCLILNHLIKFQSLFWCKPFLLLLLFIAIILWSTGLTFDTLEFMDTSTYIWFLHINNARLSPLGRIYDNLVLTLVTSIICILNWGNLIFQTRNKYNITLWLVTQYTHFRLGIWLPSKTISFSHCVYPLLHLYQILKSTDHQVTTQPSKYHILDLWSYLHFDCHFL